MYGCFELMTPLVANYCNLFKTIYLIEKYRGKQNDIHYHASDKIVGILLGRSWSHDAVKITIFGVEICIRFQIEFEA